MAFREISLTLFLIHSSRCAAWKFLRPQADSQKSGIKFVSPDLADEGFVFKERNRSAPNVTYDHMPKAGGTYIIDILQAAVPDPQNLEIRTEFEGMKKKDEKSTFSIGSVRNPCDWYVSLWAYGAEGLGNFLQFFQDEFGLKKWLSVYGTTEKKDTAEDVDKFREWLHLISVQNQPGALSIRLAASYGFDKFFTSLDLQGPASMYDAGTLDRARGVMEQLDPGRVDCWVHTENLINDATFCLQTWERDNVDGLKVDWAAFEEAAANTDPHSAVHGSCSIYFDDDLVEFVKSIDPYAFQLFNYTNCCA